MLEDHIDQGISTFSKSELDDCVNKLNLKADQKKETDKLASSLHEKLRQSEGEELATLRDQIDKIAVHWGIAPKVVEKTGPEFCIFGICLFKKCRSG